MANLLLSVLFCSQEKMLIIMDGPFGHNNYILRMTDPDRLFYVMSEEKK